MIKIVMLIRRKEGLTREAFRTHYEEVHAPLVVRDLVHLRGYARSYPQLIEGRPEPDFDVMTELWFDDLEAWAATGALLRDKDKGHDIAEDQAGLMDRASLRVAVTEECVTRFGTDRTGAEA